MSSIGSASLLAATAQLQEVQSVVNAIHRADLASGKIFGALGIELDPNPGAIWPASQNQTTVEPEPKILPRPVIQLAPRYLPGPVVYTRPKKTPQQYEVGPTAKPSPPIAAPPPPPSQLPWPVPPAAIRTIKMLINQPDLQTKGAMIDLFI